MEFFDCSERIFRALSGPAVKVLLMNENPQQLPQNQPGSNPEQGSTPGSQSPSYGASPQERTQQLPMGGYGPHQQQQFAPQGGQPRPPQGSTSIVCCGSAVAAVSRTLSKPRICCYMPVGLAW